MKNPKIWQGVRMRRIALGADPDQPLRALTLPAAWDDAAAAALAELAPGSGPASLALLADAWIRPIAERALKAGYQLHVPKPFDPRTIVQAVHQIVRTSS